MSEPHRIQILSDRVANMIAAGEVVERPRSVLKELMENALDAGARRVDVDVLMGGRRLVAVSDDGIGMGKDDALLCVERHATSKIRDAADLERIATLGFRGEALAAIASVSRFKLRTCRAGDLSGTELALAGGKVLEVRDAAAAPGTAVEVRDLFFNMPARRKFLRSERTELVHIRQFFMIQAIARPDVCMNLTVDGRPMYRLAGNATMQDRLVEMFGAAYLKNLRAVDYSDNGMRIVGYVSVPAANRSDRSEQYFFVNNRPIGSALLGSAAREGYRTLLPANRQPSLFLFLTVDPADVDVNVHPAKREVRFKHASAVRDLMVEAVHRALSSGGFGEKLNLDSQAFAPAGATRPLEDPFLRRPMEKMLAIDDLPPARSFRYPRMEREQAARPEGGTPPDKTAPAAGVPPKTAAGAGTATTEAGARQPEADKGVARDTPWAWCRILGQVGGLFVLLETEDGMVIMDPHAAHERVQFERFMSESRKGAVQTQGLLVTESVTLTPSDALRVRNNIETLRGMGIGIAEFGGDSFVVDALPLCLAGTAADMLLKDIAAGLEEAGSRGSSAARQEIIAQAACKASVRARDRMNLAEIEQLVVDLAKTEMPYTCPHGRPTLIYTSFAELRRKFGRG